LIIMPIAFQCPQCSKAFNVGDELAGKQARCGCGTVILVPPAVAAPVQQQPAPVQQQPLAPSQPVDPLMGPLTPTQPMAATAPMQPMAPGQQVPADGLAGMPPWQQQPGAAGQGGGVKWGKIAAISGAAVGGVLVLGLCIWLVISLVGGGNTVSQSDLDRWEHDLKEGTPEEKFMVSLEIYESLNAVMTTVTDVDSAKAALEELKKIKQLTRKFWNSDVSDEADPAEKKRLRAKYGDRMLETMKDLNAHGSRIQKVSKEAFEIINNVE
jgi:hypothetical protein